jgi:hypothetical protein
VAGFFLPRRQAVRIRLAIHTLATTPQDVTCGPLGQPGGPNVGDANISGKIHDLISDEFGQSGMLSVAGGSPMSDPRWTGPAASIWALVCGLRNDRLGRRTLVAWRAYIDDSGHRPHSPVLVLGGWIAPIAKWAEFVPDWQQMLNERPPIDYFKMNEAARLIGQFNSWSEERRDGRVRLAYGVIEKHLCIRCHA